jgi:hypothetical protein
LVSIVALDAAPDGAEDAEWVLTGLQAILAGRGINIIYHEEVNKMRYGFGRGGGMGFGFRGASPPWPYVGRGRGGLPRCGYFIGSDAAPVPRTYDPAFYQSTPAPGVYPSYPPPLSKEEELDYLNNQAEAIKRQLEEIESRMHALEADKE